MEYSKPEEKVFYKLGSDYKTLFVLCLFALLPTVVIIYLLPETRDKYQLELTGTVANAKSQTLSYYVNQPGDDSPMRVDVFDFGGYLACCRLYYHSNSVTDQINFYGHLPIQSNINLPIFCDVTGDGSDDLFVFTQKEDSIFLNGINLINNEVLCYGRFIAVIGDGQNDAPDFVLRPIMNYDYNKDGVQEMYFLINAGFALTPRMIFAYDYVNDRLNESSLIGGQHFVKPVYVSPDSVCLVSTTLSTNNYAGRALCDYSDSCSWLIYYDMALEICKPVHSFEGTGSRIRGPRLVNGRTFFYLTNTGGEIRSDYILELDNDSHKLSRIGGPFEIGVSRISEVNYKGESHYLVYAKEDGVEKTYEIDFERGEINSTSFSERLPRSEMVSCLVAGQAAYLSKDVVTGNTLLLLDGLKNSVSFDMHLDVRPYCLYFQTKTVRGKTIIHMKDSEHLHTYVLSKTALYTYRYGIWLAIYLLNVVFIYFIGRFYKRKMDREIRLQNQLRELKMKLLNSQLEPHFTYNVLNLISSKVLQGDKLEAYDLISHFAAFMRSALVNTNNSSWTIKEELSFLEHYKILMESRQLGCFDLEVRNDLDDGLFEMQMPRLMIQNAVENSVKYAFKQSKESGLIVVKLTADKQGVMITIKDNGIGIDNYIKTSPSDERSTGQGLLMSQKQIELYNKMNETSLSYKVEQVGEGEASQGTLVTIKLSF